MTGMFLTERELVAMALVNVAIAIWIPVSYFGNIPPWNQATPFASFVFESASVVFALLEFKFRHDYRKNARAQRAQTVSTKEAVILGALVLASFLFEVSFNGS
ncbi:MAG: hypothetical protein M1368_00370, partial [Thaumarchaeota archaeon]|nr:hypothetical protein [Nitrososphaerota archaeon]